MSFINEKTKEISCKVVYYGAPKCGKTTTLQKIYEQVKKGAKGELISLNNEVERTLYFDFVPISLGTYKGYTIRLHLYTVPGEIGYKQARALTSKGLDGVVFIVDSQLQQLEKNVAALHSLEEVLQEQGQSLENTPHIFHYNKRDLKAAAPLKELSSMLNKFKAAEFETVSTKGDGVFEGLQEIGKLVLLNLKKKSS